MRDARGMLSKMCDSMRLPGRRSWFLVAPYSRGDTYLVCALMEAFRRQHGHVTDDIVLLVKRSHAPIAEMFREHVSRLMLLDDHWLDLNAAELGQIGVRSALVPDEAVLVHPRHMDDGRADALTLGPEFSQKSMYQHLLRLPADATLSVPRIDPAWRQEAASFAASERIPAGRSVLLMPDAYSFPTVEEVFWERLAAGLAEAGWTVFTNMFGKNNAPGRKAPIAGTRGVNPPFQLLLPLAEHAGWVVATLTGGMNILITAQAQCRKTVVVRGPAPGSTLKFGDLCELDSAFPYAFQQTYDGELYNLEEFEVRSPEDHAPVVQRICTGMNAAAAKPPSAVPMPRVTADTSPADVLDRITILEIKEQALSAPVALHDVRRELLLLRTRLKRAVDVERADLRAAVADLKGVNLAAWNTNELIFKGFADDFGQAGWRLDAADASAVERSQEMVCAFRQSQRLNRQRVALKKQINELLAYQTIEQKSYDDPTLQHLPMAPMAPTAPTAPMPPLEHAAVAPQATATATATPTAIATAPAPSAADPDAELAMAALHAIQFVLSPKQRDAAAAAIASGVRQRVPSLQGPRNEVALSALATDGLLSMGPVLEPAEVKDVVDHFMSRPCYSAHVASQSDGVARSVAQAAERGVYGSYRLQDSLEAPHLTELALNPNLLSLCEHHFGCVPTLYSVHVWWTFAGHRQPGLTHGYHRDPDDHRFLAMFMYLTDVQAEDGPIDFLRGTHRPEVVEAALVDYRQTQPDFRAIDAARFFPPLGGDGYDNAPGKVPVPYKALFARHRSTLTGAAGSGFLADTFALHRGNPPTRHHRLACWIRYGLSKHRIVVEDKTEPVPASRLAGRVPRSPQLDWATRLVIDPRR